MLSLQAPIQEVRDNKSSSLTTRDHFAFLSLTVSTYHYYLYSYNLAAHLVVRSKLPLERPPVYACSHV